MSLSSASSTSISSLPSTSFSSHRLPLEGEKPKSLLEGSLCEACQDRLAITFQKCTRGYLARKPFLRSHTYEQFHTECEKTEEAMGSGLVPRAKGGKVPVYLPREMPDVVLKFLRRDGAVERFDQMRTVRAILDSQKSSHLIVPKAALCQNFLVEERLPINIDWYHNIALYLSNASAFDEPVKELVRLFSKGFIDDLVHPQRYPLAHIEGVGDFVRSDNFPFYIVEKNGKKEVRIGLIDLEQYSEEPRPHGFAIIARIFPLHLNIIEQEAYVLGMEVDRALLKNTAEKGKKYLRGAYIYHHQWLKQRGFSNHVSLQSFRIHPKRTKDLIPILKNALLVLNQGINDVYPRKYTYESTDRNFLKGNREEVAEELAVAIAPMLIHNIKEEIREARKDQINENSLKNYITDAEMVGLRSPVLERHNLCKGVRTVILDMKAAGKMKLVLGATEIMEKLLEVVLQELVRGGEIFSFDPAFYSAGNDYCWIRY